MLNRISKFIAKMLAELSIFLYLCSPIINWGSIGISKHIRFENNLPHIAPNLSLHNHLMQHNCHASRRKNGAYHHARLAIRPVDRYCRHCTYRGHLLHALAHARCTQQLFYFQQLQLESYLPYPIAHLFRQTTQSRLHFCRCLCPLYPYTTRCKVLPHYHPLLFRRLQKRLRHQPRSKRH